MLAADADKHFIQEMLVARIEPTALRVAAKSRPKCSPPLPDGLGTDLNAARRQDRSTSRRL